MCILLKLMKRDVATGEDSKLTHSDHRLLVFNAF